MGGRGQRYGLSKGSPDMTVALARASGVIPILLRRRASDCVRQTTVDSRGVTTNVTLVRPTFLTSNNHNL